MNPNYDRLAVVNTAADWVQRDPLFIDTETTGTGSDAQMVSIAVIDLRGVILHTLIRPTCPISPDAAAVHGITEAMVEHAPGFLDVWPLLLALFRGRTVITYNANFDFRILHQTMNAHGLDPALLALNGVTPKCAMLAYAQYYGDWNSRHGSYRWQTLSKAAAQCGLAFEGEAHDALADTLMARAVVLHMAGQVEKV